MSQRTQKQSAVLLVALSLLAAISVQGLNVRAAESGDIVLSQASLRQESGQLFLTARADFNLPDTVRSGLDSGVPLNFILTLRFIRPKRFWFDTTVLQHQERYSITYYELTRHYRVKAINSGISRNYRSLSSALDGLGQIRDLSLSIDQNFSDITDDTTLLAALDFRLDTSALPLPLQPFIASSWRLASKEVVWPVN